MNTRTVFNTNDGSSQLRPFLLAVTIFAVGVVLSLFFTGLPH